MEMVSILGVWYQNLWLPSIDLALLLATPSSWGNFLTIQVGSTGNPNFYYSAATEQPLKEALPNCCPPDS